MSEPRFKDLATVAGVREVYGPSTPDDTSALITQRVAKYLAKYPALANTPVRGGDVDAYDYATDRLLLNNADPDVLAHEAEHADTLRGSNLYRRLLGISRTANAIGNAAALPAVFGLMPLIKDKEKRRSIMHALAGVTALTAVPGLFEEARASTRVVGNSENKARSAAVLIPAFASHLVHDLAGPAIYLGGSALSAEE